MEALDHLAQQKNIVRIYDTTLRDGAQAEDVNFSLEDKLRIAQKLNDLGIHYIEGGWPGSNPKDIAFFEKAKFLKLQTSKVVAFGSTRRPGLKCEDDPSIQALLDAGTKAVAIVGKAWDLHTKDVLGVSLEENLDIVYDTLSYLKSKLPEVIFDAEHYFDGYKANRDYAIKVIKAAEEASVNVICLCDTNGGTMPETLKRIISDTQDKVHTPLGIHTHNDSEMAVANTIMAVKQGIRHVQGTINGFGERCGNANLCSVIPNIMLKLGHKSIPLKNLSSLKDVSSFVYELTNISPAKHQPYVGDSAFAHKGGIHVSAIRKNPLTYEHISPEKVGNRQRILISELSGRSNIVSKAEEFGLDLAGADPEIKEVLDKVKELENQGYHYEAAEASLELLMQDAMNARKKYFKLIGFRVIDEKHSEGEAPHSEATIMVEVDGVQEHTAAHGDGPVNALDNALRKALEAFFPSLEEMKLTDYKVRVLPAGKGTASRVRVLIESADKEDRWGTVGVSENIIEASWIALCDSVDYKLYKDEKKKTQKAAIRKRA